MQKLSSTFGAALWEPDRDLPQQEKKDLAAEFSPAGEDDHIRDALAAARSAYNEYHSLLERAQRKASEADIVDDEMEPVLEAAVKAPATVEQEIASLTEDTGDSRTSESGQSDDTDWKTVAERYRQDLQRKETTIKQLESHLAEVKNQRDALETVVEKKDKEMRKDVRSTDLFRKMEQQLEDVKVEKADLAGENKALHDTIATYEQALHHLVYNDWEPVPIVRRGLDVKNDITTVNIDGTLETPLPKTVKTVITSKERMKKYARKGFATIDQETVEAIELDEFLVVNPETLTIKTDSSKAFEEWLEGYRERNR